MKDEKVATTTFHFSPFTFHLLRWCHARGDGFAGCKGLLCLEGKEFQPLDTIGTIDRMEEHEVNLRQFMAQQEEAHHGIREVRISNVQTDTAQKITNVFLVLCFGDSVNEEIVVPMVERQGRWRMK